LLGLRVSVTTVIDFYVFFESTVDVSEKFHVSKTELLNIKNFDATIEINEKNIKLTMKMGIIKRNKVLAKCLEALTINNINLPSSTQEIAVTC